LLERGLRDLGQDARLLEAQQHLSESLAEQQRSEYVEQACREARSLQNQRRFDEAILVLEACESRYPGAPGVADLLLAVRKDRQAHLAQQEIDQVLVRAAAAIAAGEAENAIGILEEAVKSHPESSDLAEAAAELRATLTAARSRQEALPTALPAAPHRSVRRLRTLWIAGGVLLAGVVVFRALHPHSTPSPPTIQIPKPPDTLSIEQPTWPDTIALGQAFSQTLRASGGLPPISWEIAQGSLPQGLSLDSSAGRVEGTPSEVGPYSFAVKASDGAGHRAERTMTITVGEPEAPPPPEPCRPRAFLLEQYGDSRTGELVWTGRLQAGRKIWIQNRRASSGSVDGDVLPRGVPVRISISPASIRPTLSPSAANCWAPRLVLRTVDEEATEIRIKWEVFQP